MVRTTSKRIVYGSLAALIVFAGGFAVATLVYERKERHTLADRTGTDLARFAQIGERLASNDVNGAMQVARQEVLWRNEVIADLQRRDPGALAAVHPMLQIARRSLVYDPAFAKVLDWEVADSDRARIAFSQNVLISNRLAPELSIAAWIDGAHSLAELRGKVVLLDFWATSCGPCIAGMPKLQAIQEEFRSQGLIVLTIHAAGPRETVEQFIRTKPIGLPIGIDAGQTFDDYGVRAMPTKALINKSGHVIWSPDVLDPSRRTMTDEQETAELREVIRKALNG